MLAGYNRRPTSKQTVEGDISENNLLTRAAARNGSEICRVGIEILRVKD